MRRADYKGPISCSGCGCNDNKACVVSGVPCHWVLLDIETPTGVCSVCAVELDWHPLQLVMIGREDEPELLVAAGGGGFRR